MENINQIAENLENAAVENNTDIDNGDKADSENVSRGETENNALETREKSEIVLSEIENHRAGLYLAEKYLPKERIDSIASELSEIDELENTKTVEMRRELGTLPESFRKTEMALISNGVNPSLMTVEEATGLNDYMNNATPEIKEKKTKIIAGAIARTRNGVRNRRDWNWNSEKSRRFDYLTEKYERYERGEIDTECGYDKEYYLNGGVDGYVDDNRDFNTARASYDFGEPAEGGASDSDYTRFYRDMGVRSQLERDMEEMDVNELLENDLISEDDLFVYGPFTSRDLDGDYGIFKNSAWIDASNFRDKTATAELLRESVKNRIEDVETDLARGYVAHEILKNRRPSVKNMLSMVASLGIEYAEKTKDEIKEVLSDEQAKKLKDDISFAAYYSARVLDMRIEGVKDKYGTSRPVSKEFFEEVLKESEALTETKAEWIEGYQAPYIIKLNDRLSSAEAFYESLINKEEKEDAGSDFEGLALPSFDNNLLGQTTGNLTSLE